MSSVFLCHSCKILGPITSVKYLVQDLEYNSEERLLKVWQKRVALLGNFSLAWRPKNETKTLNEGLTGTSVAV